MEPQPKIIQRSTFGLQFYKERTIIPNSDTIMCASPVPFVLENVYFSKKHHFCKTLRKVASSEHHSFLFIYLLWATWSRKYYAVTPLAFETPTSHWVSNPFWVHFIFKSRESNIGHVLMKQSCTWSAGHFQPSLTLQQRPLLPSLWLYWK